MEDITLLGDEPLEAEQGVCFRVTRECDNVRHSPYRTFDGSCNNLTPGRENFGSIERALKRRLPVQYSGK